MDDDHGGDDVALSSENSEHPSAFVQEAACAERVIVLKVRQPGRTSFIVVGATRKSELGAGVLSSEMRREIWPFLVLLVTCRNPVFHQIGWAEC